MESINHEYKVVGKGNTILVIDVGIGNSFYDLYPLIEEIKDYFTVIIYHRQGYGKSSLPKSPRTTRNIAYELNTMLKEIGIKEKYILMGHSFGGLCVQQYAKMYPNEIKAIVLLDSTSYNLAQLDNLDTPIINSHTSINKMADLFNELSLESREELISQNTDMVSKYEKYVGSEELQDVVEFFGNPNLYKTVADEFANWIHDGEDIKSMDTFPDVPLRVIARDKMASVRDWMKYDIPEEEAVRHENKWRELQEELTLLSNQGELIIASDSDHLIYIDRPDIVIECLKSLI
ncbi:alpha/beta hydrolase [Tissierella pigra]|uniref:alpha/beta hydrolase n=1 Tax=Tissierella pigra TaxID=2607614 RepID=UPI001C10E76C|nr:alpha/beta fold hydrolase [Tissierella pigra]MBU5425551.1 alpha/beta hydrolase [Tissierella pigra]